MAKKLHPETTSLEVQLALDRHADERRLMAAELKKRSAQENRLRQYLAILDQRVEAYKPTPLVKVPTTRGRRTKLPTQDLILVVGDWHLGLQVAITETGAMYEQNVATTREQVYRLWERVVRLHEIQSSGVNFNKLHIISLGDLVEGDDMRPAQHRGIEELVVDQALHAGDLFAWLSRQALQLFPEVEVDMVGGNHDRIGRNRGNAGLGELGYIDTFAYLIGGQTQRLFAEEPRIKVRNWKSFFGYKLIGGQRVIFEHGSSFRWNANSYGGVPWYAVSMLPKKYADMLGKPDLTLIGHGHRPGLIPDGRGWLVVNGALPATSNYEQSSFKSIHRPLQTLLSVHPEHGLINWQPIYLDVPGTVEPGEVWTNPEYYAALANDELVEG